MPLSSAPCSLLTIRQNKTCSAVDQNISMRHFASGRVQSMWTLSSEMIDFVTVMTDAEKPDVEKFEAFEKAAAPA